MPTADDGFRIDGYKFLPRSMIPEFKAFPYQAGDVVKAAPAVSVKKAQVALLTSSGLYLKDRQPSFDLEPERREPLWGDPTYGVIPRDVGRVEVSGPDHLLNPDLIVPNLPMLVP